MFVSLTSFNSKIEKTIKKLNPLEICRINFNLIKKKKIYFRSAILLLDTIRFKKKNVKFKNLFFFQFFC